MYSSLTKIDIAADAPEGALHYQTDHRSRAEIEETPELSVVFALTRIRNAKRHQGKSALAVYAANDVPPFLQDAIAAAGGVIEGTDRVRHAPPAPSSTVAELADRAFRGLAARVQRRLGADDPTAALRALEAEVVAAPPTLETDEVGYWTSVCELSALAAEILRAAHAGSWTESEHPVVPFGFSLDDDTVLLLTNRAQRFLEDGDGESMFLIVDSVADMRAHPHREGPLLPSLRALSDAIDMGVVHRPLFDGADKFPEVPVIAYGRDSPTTFGFTRATGDEDVAQLHAEALRNLADQPASIESVEIDGLTLLAVQDSFYAAEKLLDTAFMRTLHDRLGPVIAVVVPRRGLLLAIAMNAQHEIAGLAAFAKTVATGSRQISDAVLLVHDGEVRGVARVEPAKKPSWWRRLWHRN